MHPDALLPVNPRWWTPLLWAVRWSGTPTFYTLLTASSWSQKQNKPLLSFSSPTQMASQDWRARFAFADRMRAVTKMQVLPPHPHPCTDPCSQLRHREHLVRTTASIRYRDYDSRIRRCCPRDDYCKPRFSCHLGLLGPGSTNDRCQTTLGNAACSLSGPCCACRRPYKPFQTLSVLFLLLVCNAGLHQANFPQNRRLPCLESSATGE